MKRYISIAVTVAVILVAGIYFVRVHVTRVERRAVVSIYSELINTTQALKLLKNTPQDKESIRTYCTMAFGALTRLDATFSSVLPVNNSTFFYGPPTEYFGPIASTFLGVVGKPYVTNGLVAPFWEDGYLSEIEMEFIQVLLNDMDVLLAQVSDGIAVQYNAGTMDSLVSELAAFFEKWDPLIDDSPWKLLS